MSPTGFARNRKLELPNPTGVTNIHRVLSNVADADEGSKPEIHATIAQTTAALTKLKTIWNDRKIAPSSKIRLMRSLVMSIFLYACEYWTLTAETERRIQAMEMSCLRKLLGIIYKDHISNEEVRNRTQQAIGPTKTS